MPLLPNFSEERLPDEIALGASGGAVYSTNILTMASGHEQRNINWLCSRARYDLAPAIRSSGHLESLIIFFRAHKGRGIGFRFRDWADYNAQDEPIAIGNGITASFQLCKSYTQGVCVDRRIINKPLPSTINAYIDGKLTGLACDCTTGIISLSEVPATGAIITASFEFDVPVRFDTDSLDLGLEHFGSVSIPVIEIRV